MRNSKEKDEECWRRAEARKRGKAVMRTKKVHMLKDVNKRMMQLKKFAQGLLYSQRRSRSTLYTL